MTTVVLNNGHKLRIDMASDGAHMALARDAQANYGQSDRKRDHASL